ncbi:MULTISPECIES: bifunctional adenosylcobinamide kinase/adenosylcobinamide-phosphate guanylyltransferase [unclassified Lysinibacillus]|uniref:bifunctional adenosylcobinamide kinase/adenosylcobinamide-phosphate guanylyltransferase n=1 Tax=unclassified Lysinibacillus TaxID=2636778 RepID=UPI003816BAFD
MHVFIGGAYNGKTAYVTQLLEEQEVAVMNGVIPEVAPACDALIIKNLEHWLIKQNLEEDEVIVKNILTNLKILEEGCQLYIIVTDMGRGVVPMEKQTRLLRDTCGRLYQALFAEAKQVDRIWYGIAERIK